MLGCLSWVPLPGVTAEVGAPVLGEAELEVLRAEVENVVRAR